MSSPKKRSRKKATLWNLAFSYSNFLYAIISGIVLVPFYLSEIPYELYGGWLATGNVVTWLSMIDGGLSLVIMQRVARCYGKEKFQEIGAYIRSGLGLSLILFLLLVIFGWKIAPFLPNWVNLAEPSYQDQLVDAFRIVVIGVGLTLLSYVISGSSKGLLSSFGPGLITLCVNLTSLIVIIVTLFYGYGLYAIAFGFLFRGFFNCLLNLIFLLIRLKRERIHILSGSSKALEVLSLLSFTSIGRASAKIAYHCNAFIIAALMGVAYVTPFVLSYKILSILEAMSQKPVGAISSSLSHLHGENNLEKLKSYVLTILRMFIWGVALACGLVISVNSEFVSLWVGGELFVGHQVNFYLTLLFAAKVVTTALSGICISLGDIKINSFIKFLQSLSAISLTYLGVKYFGWTGAAVAPMLGHLVITFLYYPASLFRLGVLRKNDLILLIKEALTGTLAALVVIHIAEIMVAETWGLLVAKGVLLSVVYVFTVMILSRHARTSGIEIILKITRNCLKRFRKQA